MSLETPPAQDRDLLFELPQFVDRINESLIQAGASYAERAFGLGCGLGLLPALAVIGILFALGVINLILAATLFVIAVLALIGISNLLAYTARLNAVRKVYSELVEPEIARYLSGSRMTRQQFDNLAADRLGDDAPLLSFLHPLAQDDRERLQDRSE